MQNHPLYDGLLLTVDALDNAIDGVPISKTILGTTVGRTTDAIIETDLAQIARSKQTCAENLAHPVLYPHCEGGRYNHENACSDLHHTRARFFGVN